MASDSPASRSATQLRLALERDRSFDRGSFVVSSSNRLSVAAVDRWPDWPGGLLVLVGPEGSGKTHLALAWATRSGARLIDPSHIDVARLPAGPALLENADRFIADTALFHLINRAEAEGGLLLTARSAPRAWTTSLPDLRSRLNALPTAELGVADDAVLEGVLRRFFRDRNIRPDEDLIPYLLHRMERSVPAALAMVARLDEAADASRRGVTRALAREILETLDNGSDPRA